MSRDEYKTIDRETPTELKRRKANAPETSIVKSIMLAIGAEPDFRLWRNNTGALTDVTGRVVKFGLAPGSADLIGILAPWGRLIALEVKTHRRGSKQSEDQRNWEKVIREMGGVYEVVRSASEAIEVLRVARDFRGVQRLKVEGGVKP